MFTYSQALTLKLVAGLFLELRCKKKGKHNNDDKKKRASEMPQEEQFSSGLQVNNSQLSFQL